MDLTLKRAKALSKEDMKLVNPFSTHERFITKQQVEEFDDLLDSKSSETKIDQFLVLNPEVFAAALHNYRTGHHAAIVIPKQEIRPRLKIENVKGLIPDFIIGGKNSDGWGWWIVELKGSEQMLFTQTGSDTYFSSEINKGICQLLEYIDFCSEQQSSLRDLFKLDGFREPQGLLIAGREKEISGNTSKQKLKSAWNRLNPGKLEIRTYDFIRHNLHTIYDFNH